MIKFKNIGFDYWYWKASIDILPALSFEVYDYAEKYILFMLSWLNFGINFEVHYD